MLTTFLQAALAYVREIAEIVVLGFVVAGVINAVVNKDVYMSSPDPWSRSFALCPYTPTHLLWRAAAAAIGAEDATVAGVRAQGDAAVPTRIDIPAGVRGHRFGRRAAAGGAGDCGGDGGCGHRFLPGTA